MDIYAAHELKAREYESQLRPRLTDEFLATLIEAARTVGWGVDLIEVDSFIQSVFHIAGKPKPEHIEPYLW